MEFTIFFLLLAAAGVNFVVGRQTATQRAVHGLALARIEHKLNAIIAHHGIVLAEPGYYATIRTLVQEGQKAEAIRLWRLKNPTHGLAEAKAAVEAIGSEHA